MTHFQNPAFILPQEPGYSLSMAVLGEAYTKSVLRNGSAAVSKTAGRGSIPRSDANPPAEGLRAEAGSVSAATPRLSVLARAGGFSFSGVAA